MPATRSRVLSAVVPRSGLGWLLAVLSVLLLVAAVLGLVAHFRAPGRAWVLGISAFAPYLMLGAPVALIVLAVGRLWLPAVAAFAITLMCVVTQAALFTCATPPADAVQVTVMTSNLRLGLADPSSVVGAVRRHHVDVLMLEELTPTEQGKLIAAGLDEALPHHVSAPTYAALGTGLWSRYPLTSTDKRHDFTFNFVTARVSVPHLGRDVQLAAAHMAGPWPNPFGWHHDIAHLPTVLHGLGSAGPAILGGDFNATPDVAQFRALLTGGWADGAAQAGAGYTRTYPSDRAFPPLIAIDHVLTHDAVATSAQTVEIPGSDHRALVVQVAVPRSS